MSTGKWRLTFVLFPVLTIDGQYIFFTFAKTRRCIRYYQVSRFDWFGQCKKPPTIWYEYKLVSDTREYLPAIHK